jgi:CIC family chloride channel protein
MGALFAGAARAPITAVLILFELTGEYSIILPIMLAVVAATAISRTLTPDTIYLLKLRRRGIDLDAPPQSLLGHSIPVRDMMGAMPQPVRIDDGLATVIEQLTHSSGAVPVIDDTGTYRGIIAASAAEGQAVGAATHTRALDLATLPDTLVEDDSLDRAVELLAHADGAAGVPVLNGAGMVTGWMTHQSLLRALHQKSRGMPTALSVVHQPTSA